MHFNSTKSEHIIQLLAILPYYYFGTKSKFVPKLSYLMLQPRIPILMYHSVLPSTPSASSVTIEQLEQQLLYIKKQGYTTLFIDELENQHESFRKPIALTFDDAYLNNYHHLIPLLEKYQVKATIMVPTGYLGQLAGWYKTDEKLMSIEELRRISTSPHIRLGLHTHMHINLRHTPLELVKEDLITSIKLFTNNNIPFTPMLAYPFGAYPKKKDGKEKHQQFTLLLKTLGITHGLRIGNRLNKLPFANPYEIKRVDIKGTDTFFSFKIKLLVGYINPF